MYLSHRRRLRTTLVRRTISMLFIAISLAVSGACQTGGGLGNQARMFVSTKEFNRGRNDGRRDAKLAWSDDSAAWTWNWMMDAQYKEGYQQGWREGRAEVKFQAQQEDARAWQEQQQAEQGDDSGEE